MEPEVTDVNPQKLKADEVEDGELPAEIDFKTADDPVEETLAKVDGSCSITIKNIKST